MTRSAVVSRYLQTWKKYKREFIDIARRLCERGNTDEEIATILGMSGRTLHSWKLQHEEFASALKRSKAEVNELVEASLFTRAADFEREVEKVFRNGKRLKFREYYPPNLGAIRLWLQNPDARGVPETLM